jgi:hypothetical protein
MVAVHNTGMEFLRRTMLPNQSTEGVTEGVRRATQLLRLFATQTETLLRYRGGGRQSIVVEHVNVNAGGQAIVGNVTHSSGRTEGGGDETQKWGTTPWTGTQSLCPDAALWGKNPHG